MNFTDLFLLNLLGGDKFVFKLEKFQDCKLFGMIYEYNNPRSEVVLIPDNDAYRIEGTEVRGLIFQEFTVRLDPPSSKEFIPSTRWYSYTDETHEYEPLEITYTRSGVTFFEYDDETLNGEYNECFFVNGSVMSLRLLPAKVFIPEKYKDWIFENKSGLTEFYPESKAKTEIDRLFILK